MEVTSLDENPTIAKSCGHTTLKELVEWFSQCPIEDRPRELVLKHFSMRYTKQQIIDEVTKYSRVLASPYGDGSNNVKVTILGCDCSF
jgi:ribonuclease BN (tRNA processing enzyme)